MNRFSNLQKLRYEIDGVKSKLKIIKKIRRIGSQNFICKDYCKMTLGALKNSVKLFNILNAKIKAYLIPLKNICEAADTQTQMNLQKPLYAKLKNRCDFIFYPLGQILKNDIKPTFGLITFETAKARYMLPKNICEINTLKNSVKNAIYADKEFIKASIYWIKKRANLTFLNVAKFLTTDKK
ncbi:MAG: hypothetical protein LBD84_06585 [Campylobacteraceae bacterium]|jgi:hypothetical protein|nr:hypothetical protein [Campylobacteraceae bacterium]